MSATIDLESFEAFVAVVHAGGFTAAAKARGTHKAHLSRVVGRLEAALGVRLLHRTTRSLTLTEEGREFYERGLTILAAVEDTKAAMQRARGEPQGLLRLTCGVEFGALAVTDWINSFLVRHPAVRVEADYTNRLVDIVHEGFDVAIRVGELEDSSLSARRLGEVTYGFYASPAYLTARSEPASPGDLASHEVVLFVPGRAPPLLRLVRGAEETRVEVAPRLLVNNNMAARQAVVAGLGVAQLPRIEAAAFVESGQLVPILAGWARQPAPVHALFPSGRYLAPKVRAFVDHARGKFASLEGGREDPNAPEL